MLKNCHAILLYATINNNKCLKTSINITIYRKWEFAHKTTAMNLFKYSVSVVDDSASMRQALGIALQGAGYDVLASCDGVDALAKLKGQKVNLIISEVNMPNMDGISVLKAVKLMPAYKLTPAIMLTTVYGEERKAEGRAAGARAWVCKPFAPQQLVDAVQRSCLP